MPKINGGYQPGSGNTVPAYKPEAPKTDMTPAKKMKSPKAAADENAKG